MNEKASAVERVLVVSALSGAENGAAAIMQQMGLDVEVVPGRREGLEALRAGNYAAVIVDDSLAEGDPRWRGSAMEDGRAGHPDAGELCADRKRATGARPAGSAV